LSRDELKALLEDKSSGASQIALRAAKSLLSLEREEALRWSELLCRAHPEMIPLRNLNLILRSSGVDGLRKFIDALELGKRKIPEEVTLLFGKLKRNHLSTLSWSSTVFECVLTLERRNLLEDVLVGESLPGGEGRRTSALLSKHGVIARVVPDALLPWLSVYEERAVLVGADAIYSDGTIVNKAGTMPLALVCRHHGLPVVVVSDTTKIWHDPMSEEERFRVFKGRTFDVTPPDAVSAIVTERGIFEPPFKFSSLWI